ncbi:hypothetical protein SAMN05421812_103577 [Asanoa hainanensis]|uniref:Uncharacterized protein n=1 Tax=Asanoa hainanensis TaxID=560556 RepID=A0A239KJC5_9ACTN|nr:hypothetical protein SAMN05421812_103577 [Asanoa hainanensis]
MDEMRECARESVTSNGEIQNVRPLCRFSQPAALPLTVIRFSLS